MCVIAILGGIFQQFMTVPTLIIGRLMYGFAGGTLSVVLGKSLAETVPAKHLGTFGSATQSFAGIGIVFQYSLGFILPQDPDEMMTTQRWRVMHSTPSLFALVQALLFLIAVKEEPVAFNIAAGKSKEAETMLKLIYPRGRMKKRKYDERITKLVEEQSLLTSRESTSTTFWTAVLGPKFWKASWICAALFLCMRLSGIGLVSIYVYSMLNNIAVETNH